MTSVVGYVRVSTREQTESGLSISSQERRIHQYCEYKSLNLVKIIKDENVSAGIPLADRVGGGELQKLALEHQYGVVAIKLDRLFRDAHDCLGVTKEWSANGVMLHLMDLGIDTNTAMGRAFLTNAATYAELEKNLISERTREALNQIKIEGGILGTPRYGWQFSEEKDDNGHNKLERNPAEANYLHLCVALREMGFTYQQIADKFNSEGIPSKRGGKWHPSAVRNCCINADKS